MPNDDLLRRVLPIDSAPGFIDEYNCNAPKYSKNPSKNIKKYKMYNMLKARIYLDNEVNYLSPETILDYTVLKLMYHPRFPDTFFNFIANSVDRMPILQTEKVGAFLEGNYSKGLKESDCDYLSSILSIWCEENFMLQPENLTIALAWIEGKRVEIRKQSANFVSSLDSIVDVSNPELQQSEHQIAVGLPPNEIKLLAEVFRAVDLLNDGGHFRETVQPGHVAGVIRYLIKQRNFTDEGSLIFIALKANFGSKISLSTIQHYMNTTQRNTNFYNKTRQYFEEVNHGR